jgi:hypothetical protein
MSLRSGLLRIALYALSDKSSLLISEKHNATKPHQADHVHEAHENYENQLPCHAAQNLKHAFHPGAVIESLAVMTSTPPRFYEVRIAPKPSLIVG